MVSINTSAWEKDEEVSDSLDALSLQTHLLDTASTASNPASAGPPRPAHDLARSQDFVPPQRPSSTPFAHSNQNIITTHCRECQVVTGALGVPTTRQESEIPAQHTSVPCQPRLTALPPEIQGVILDHVFGFTVSASSESSAVSSGTILRHPRRKELSELALVSRVWRELVQERLYQHLKVEAKTLQLAECARMFDARPHLRRHVRHLEVWFPVFEAPRAFQAYSDPPIMPWAAVTGSETPYALPRDNSSLEEVFQTMMVTFPNVHVLTIEGGDRRKAPQIRFWRGPKKPFPKLGSVQTLICKGQWNLIRNLSDFHTVISALPNLTEWHASYSKPKSKSYLAMATILPNLPKSRSKLTGSVALPNLLTRRKLRPDLGAHLNILNISLENDCRREASVPGFAQKVWAKVHLCLRLAQATRTLGHLSYTGRMCHVLFDEMARLHNTRTTRLKSVDLTVKNTCRSVPLTPDVSTGSGMTDGVFIQTFTDLVVSAIKSLNSLVLLDYLRIRFVDIDAPVPALNPYFLMDHNRCQGVWSDEIVALLKDVRPWAAFDELAHTFGELLVDSDGRLAVNHFPRVKAKSLKLSNYKLLTDGLSIT